eukprot:TRINITY_DN12246_c0_g1_i4.p1 TRINITY_DN12246_c0_g1~~TRINITY_DN12246_c0_g1_i4.p1  ORF type:complete len:319 (+),score=55.54 TRINITY_DN12246_c0_g1_i4:120-1076(+)
MGKRPAEDAGGKTKAVCNKCKQPGHVAKKCKTTCSVCSELGHIAANCPTQATCGHCQRFGHAANGCTFGAKPDERFLFCRREDGSSPCFPRYFLVPLQRASPSFDVEKLRQGRVDVGLRCITAALFRSQSLRCNAQISLCFLGGGEAEKARTVQVNGALVRDLRPDERSMAERVRAVSSSSSFSPEAEIKGELRTWSQVSTRGFYSFQAGMVEAVQRLLTSPLGGDDAPRPTVLLLTKDGKPIETVIEKLTRAAEEEEEAAPKLRKDFAKPLPGPLAGGVLVLLGDDRGLEEADELAIKKLVKEGLLSLFWKKQCRFA